MLHLREILEEQKEMIMKTNAFSDCLVCIDINAHHIPMVGTVVALVGLFEKYIVFPFMNSATITNNRYFSHISNKSLDVFLLECVPVFGSIFIHRYDKNSDYTKDQKSLLEAVRKDCAFLQHANKSLTKKAGFMIEALKINFYSMKYVDNSLKSNPKFILEAIKANSSLISDQDFILEFIKIDFLSAMERADPSLKNDPKFMLKAIRADSRVMAWTNNCLKSDPSFMLEVIKIDFRPANAWVDASLKSDRSFMLEAIKSDYRAMNWTDNSLKSNKSFLLEAIRIGSDNIGSWIDQYSLEMKQVFYKSSKNVRANYWAMVWENNSLKSDPDFMLEAIKVYFLTLKYADSSLESNQDFILQAISSLKTNPDFMLKAIKINDRILHWGDDSLKRNPIFMLEAIKIIYFTADYISGSLKKDPVFMSAAIRINERIARLYADNSLKSSSIFILEYMKINLREALDWANDSLKGNQTFILEAIKMNLPLVMDWADSSLKSDQIFMEKAIKVNHRIIEHMSEILKSNKDFMEFVVLEKPQAVTSSNDLIIHSRINLNQLELTPPSIKNPDLTPEDLDRCDIMDLLKEFDELTAAEFSNYKYLSKSDRTEKGKETASKALNDLKQEKKKLLKLCEIIKKPPLDDSSKEKKLSHNQLSFLLKNIINQWQKGKGLRYKDKNLRALAYAATKCEPTWLEEATRIYFELDGSGTPKSKLLALVQRYKEETILQSVQGKNQWHALSRIRNAHGKELGLNIDLAKHDLYMNTGEENKDLNAWAIKALWDAPSLLESIHTALSNQDHDRSLYDFLLDICKEKNINNPIGYVADNFYDDGCSFNLHGVHIMLIHIGVLEAV